MKSIKRLYQILRRRVETLSKKQKAIALMMAVVFLSCVLGVALGFVLTPKASPSPPTFPSPEYQFKDEKPKTVTMSGTLLGIGPSIYMQGTHKLLDDEGNLLALLESKNIDLSFLEGMKVEVEGKLEKTVEGDVKLLKVEKVRFR